MKRNCCLPATRLLIALALLLSAWTEARCQARQSVRTVVDAESGEPLPFAAAALVRGGTLVSGTAADAEGRFALQTQDGDQIVVSCLGYETLTTDARAGAVRIALRKTAVSLAEVRVTATEAGQTQTSTSIIGQTAMEHLQPTSLTELLTLLPGGVSQAPVLGSANLISLREIPTTDRDYATSSLGTKVNIDGAPMGTDADMQKIGDTDGGRSHVSAGVDMREIPTDNIESIEVIRGIPSVRYGDLTSGVVNITRRLTGTPVTARLKVDSRSRLVSVGKGFDTRGGWTVNADLGMLTSKIDPRNKFETFRRANVSLRARRVWTPAEGQSLTWRPSADYAQNIDEEKQDPEVQINKEDSYKNSRRRMALANTLVWVGDGWHAMLRQSASLSVERIERRQRVFNTTYAYAASDTTDGLPHDVVPLEREYIARHDVEGLPFYSNIQLSAERRLRTGRVSHEVTVGAEWQCNKNYGDGQVFDHRRPLSGSTSRRPRTFRSVPATNIVGYYAEDELRAPLGRAEARLTAGVRFSQMAGLPRGYAMRRKVYADPRFNLGVDLPPMGRARLDVTVGWGRLSKMPTMDQLHPDKVYVDIYEMSYWHSDSLLRRAIVRTYPIDRDAPALEPAHNTKVEGRLGMRLGQHSLSVSAFHERMDDGFRYMSSPMALPHRLYDLSGFDASAGVRPDPATTPYTETARLSVVTRTRNGSRTKKDGVEWQYESPRLPAIHTRLSVSGAWFHTTRENSEPEWYRGTLKTVLGVQIDNYYAGLYDWHQTTLRDRTTTTITTESFFDRVGFIFSATAECVWHSRSTTPLRSARPIAYMTTDGVARPYGDAEAADPILGALILSNTVSRLTSEERPYATFNFKATKRFGTYFTLSFFADRLLAAARDYEVDGFVVRRSFSPYFGAQAYIRL